MFLDYLLINLRFVLPNEVTLKSFGKSLNINSLQKSKFFFKASMVNESELKILSAPMDMVNGYKTF